jgi:hypothetical protein
MVVAQAQITRSDDFNETPLRKEASLETDDAVCWMLDNTPVTVLHITMQGSIKLAHIRTTEGQTGYVNEASACEAGQAATETAETWLSGEVASGVCVRCGSGAHS